MRAVLNEILHYCQTIKYTLYHQVYLNIFLKNKIMLFQPRQSEFLSVRLTAHANYLGFIEENECPKPSGFEPVWHDMLETYRILQPKPKTTDELNITLQTIWKELPQEHVTKAVAN